MNTRSSPANTANSRSGRLGPRRLLGVLAFAGCMSWAWWPLDPIPQFNPGPLSAPPESQPPASSPPSSRPAATPLDLAAFSKPLWPTSSLASVAAAPPVPPALPPSLPLRCQLLGITREPDGRFTALVYDPDADQLLLVAEGEQVAGRTASSITVHALQLRDPAGGIETLSLALANQSGGTP